MTGHGRLFLLPEDAVRQFDRRPYSSEQDLEDFLEANPHTIGDLMIIGRQVSTNGHGDVDLVAIDGDGQLWVLELKLDSATRRITEQINGYATWGLSTSRGDLGAVYASYTGGDSLPHAFERRFGRPLPTRADMRLVAAIVAFKFDEHANCQLHTMEHFGYPIRGYEYSYFYADGIEAFSIDRVNFPAHDHSDGMR